MPVSSQPPAQVFAPDAPDAVFLDPDRRRKLASAFPEIDAIVTEAVTRAKQPGAAVGVVIDGELAYAKGFGVTDAASKTPIDADSVFGLASVTKPFTALTVLALRDDRLLSLDDPLARWRYIFIVANPAEPVDLVKQLVGVVGKESEETVMNVAEWLEQKGRLEGIRTTLLTLLRLRFGDVPERTVAAGGFFGSSVAVSGDRSTAICTR